MLATEGEASVEQLLASRTFDARRTTRTTAREMTGLLAAVCATRPPVRRRARRCAD